MSRRVLAAVTALTVVVWVLLLAPQPAAGQAFWPEDTPKLPMARTWIAQKAQLPPYTLPALAPHTARSVNTVVCHMIYH